MIPVTVDTISFDIRRLNYTSNVYGMINVLDEGQAISLDGISCWYFAV